MEKKLIKLCEGLEAKAGELIAETKSVDAGTVGQALANGPNPMIQRLLIRAATMIDIADVIRKLVKEG